MNNVNIKECSSKIVVKLKEFVGNRKAVIGISGGLDSAVVANLCVKALGKENVIGVSMPYLNQSVEDAKLVTNDLGIQLIEQNILPIVDAVSAIQDKIFPPQFSQLTLGNIKARSRMILLYTTANNHNGMVIGTTNRTEAMLGYYCYDNQTRALTNKGLKYYNELMPGDTIFALNLKTKQLEEKKVKDIHTFEFKGNLIRGKNQAVDFKVTDSHRMVLQDAHNPNKVFLEPISNYLKNHIHLNIPFATNGWKSKSKTPKKLYGFDINDILYMCGLFIGDGCCFCRKIPYLIKSHKQFRSDKTGRFTVVKNPINERTEYNAYTVNFSIPENNKNDAYKKLTAILDKYEIKWHRASPIGIKIVSSDNKLYKIFRRCGVGAGNKKIPQNLLQYPSENLKYLLSGLMDSDGDKNGSYYTISPLLASQFVELTFKIGNSARIRSIGSRTAYYKGKKIISKPSHQITVCSKIHSRAISKNKITKEYYDGTIWCPEVPEHGNLIVERNGSFYFCGNTKFGDGACDVEPIADLYKTEVFELAKLLGVPKKIIEKAPSAELWEGQTDEGEIGLTYEEMDGILDKIPSIEMEYSFFDNSATEDRAIKEFGKEKYHKILKMIGNSEHKRHMPPVFELYSGEFNTMEC